MFEGDCPGDTRMTFEEYWVEVEKLKALPQTTIQLLPSSLSASTKRKLMKRPPEDSMEILRVAIDQVNRGSVESIDSLVRKQL